MSLFIWICVIFAVIGLVIALASGANPSDGIFGGLGVALYFMLQCVLIALPFFIGFALLRACFG